MGKRMLFNQITEFVTLHCDIDDFIETGTHIRTVSIADGLH